MEKISSVVFLLFKRRSVCWCRVEFSYFQKIEKNNLYTELLTPTPFSI